MLIEKKNVAQAWPPLGYGTGHRKYMYYVILNMATYRGLDDAMAAHDGPSLRRTWGRYFGTVLRSSGQSIFKTRTSGGSVKQSHDKRCTQLRCRRLLPTPENRRNGTKLGAIAR